MAAQYWIGDAAGRVLGPLGLQATRDLLASGRFPGASRASGDGRQWKPLSTFPELAVPTGVAAPAVSQVELQEITNQLNHLKGKPPREILGVPPGTGLEEARTAFFARVKLYHPSRLAGAADPRLRRAYGDMFQLLSDAMALLEREKTSPSGITAAYRMEEFVGWRSEDGKIRVELELGMENAHLLTAVEAVSANNDGFYLPSKSPLPLFQVVEVILRFKMPHREIRGRGRVVYEGTGNSQRLPQGIGIRFISMNEEDRKFLRYFAKKNEAAKLSR